MDDRDRERVAGAIAAAERAFRHARDPRVGPVWTADALAVDAIAKCVEEIVERLVGTEQQPGVSKEFQAAHPDIPWITLRRYRGFIVHNDAAVNPERLRTTLEDEVSLLVVQLRQLLDRG